MSDHVNKAKADSHVKPTVDQAETPPADDRLKDPSQWVTGGEPMTGAQDSYLHTLARQAGEDEEVVEGLTKAEASEKIDELRHKTGKA